jgi:hypothetical protein
MDQAHFLPNPFQHIFHSFDAIQSSYSMRRQTSHEQVGTAITQPTDLYLGGTSQAIQTDVSLGFPHGCDLRHNLAADNDSLIPISFDVM